MMSDNILEIENLTKTYPGVVALDNISISFRRGEVHAIVGENGAGKSTLIKSITGAIMPDKGMIRFDGKEYAHLFSHNASPLEVFNNSNVSGACFRARVQFRMNAS